MASQVEVCNRALTKLGAKRITSINDPSKSAQCLASLWDTVRMAELRRAFWQFAISRTSLAALGTAPAWGYTKQYQLPTDYLRLIQVNEYYASPALVDYREGDDSLYAIEGDKILTNLGAPLKLRYVADVTDPGVFDPLFVECLASKLAYEACYEITNSNQQKDVAANDYKAAKIEAVRIGAIEKPPVGIPDDAWILGRL